MTFSEEEFDFDTLLLETTEAMQEIYAGRDLVLERPVLTRIKADPQQIEQVIVNLINNAIK